LSKDFLVSQTQFFWYNRALKTVQLYCRPSQGMFPADPAYLLRVEKLNKSFRGLQAVRDYDLNLAQGELLGIIGPNGAGKTTLFNLLTGVVKPTSGRIYLEEADITQARPERIARLGIARTFQKLRLFKSLSALENLKVALQTGQHTQPWQVFLSWPNFITSEHELTQQARELLAWLNLAEIGAARAETLSFGQQRRLELACALALSPRLLLLDEPVGGMNPNEAEEFMGLIQRIHQQLQLTIILIEHNMQVVMGICRRIQALNYGEVIAEGEPEAIRQNADVIEAYLGHGASSR
jgi:branched-chain amino acid transport system ATP-binding protein